MNLKNIFDAFPPPQFLSLPYTGLSISDTSIRCIQFTRKHGALAVFKYAEKKLPPGVVVLGYINNVLEVSHILETLKKEMGIEYVRASLPEEKAYLFNTKIPLVSQKDVRSAIEFTIEENVPLPASELIFDYNVVASDPDADYLNVVVSAFPTKIVDMYVETFHDAGMSLLSLGIESQAVARAVLPVHNPGTFLIVHFEKEKIGFYVTTNAIVHFTSTLSTKGESLDHPSFLTQEIKKLFLYWNTLKRNVGKKDREIQEIIFCGEDFNESVAAYVMAHNKIPVSVANVWRNAFDINTTVPPISFTDSLAYASAVGLALPTDILI